MINRRIMNLPVFVPLTLLLFTMSLGNQREPIFPDMTCHVQHRKGILELVNAACQDGSHHRLNLTKTNPKLVNSKACILFGLGIIMPELNNTEKGHNRTGRYHFNFLKARTTLRKIFHRDAAGNTELEQLEIDVLMNRILKRFGNCLTPLPNITSNSNLTSMAWGPVFNCLERASGCLKRRAIPNRTRLTMQTNRRQNQN